MLTPRERVLCAMNHEEPDRVPIFFGASSPTTMLSTAYENFKAYLGVQYPPRLLSKTFQLFMRRLVGGAQRAMKIAGLPLSDP